MLFNNGYALLAALGLVWHECGHDFGVFCYRIGCGIFSEARQRVFQLIPLRATSNPARANSACSNPSFTFSARFTTPKD
jgi:hypothetical protein